MNDNSRDLLFWFLAVAIPLGIAVVLYVRAKRDKEPCYDIQNLSLIRDHKTPVAALEIRYEGQKVRSLSVAKVVIWNRGRATIDKGDLPEADPFRIVGSGDVKVRAVRRIVVNHVPTEFNAARAGETAQLRLEYLDRGHGAVFQVVHDGESEADLTIAGSIKGVARVRRVRLKSVLNTWQPREVLGVVVLGLGAFFYAGLASYVSPDKNFSFTAEFTNHWTSYVITIFWVIAGAFCFFYFFQPPIGFHPRRSRPRQLPKGLDALLDDDFGWEHVSVEGSVATATVAAYPGTVRITPHEPPSADAADD